MREPSRHRSDGSKRNLDWRGRRIRRAISKTAKLVVAPAPKRGVALDRTRVEATRRDGLQTRTKRRDLERRWDAWHVLKAGDHALHRIANLAATIFTPARHRTSGVQGAVVAKPCADRNGVVKRHDLHRRWVAWFRVLVRARLLACRRSIARFSEHVVAPAPNATVGLDCARVGVVRRKSRSPRRWTRRARVKDRKGQTSTGKALPSSCHCQFPHCRLLQSTTPDGRS